VIWRHRGLKVAPKTVNQKRYVDAIRQETITVGIGPASSAATSFVSSICVLIRR
jgi:phosphate starvation-inducible protein PhoH and related proteins